MPVGVSEVIKEIGSSNRRILVNGLCGSAPAYLLSKIRKENPRRNILVITSSPERAENFLGDLCVFSDEFEIQNTFYFPAPDVLPYSQLSPESKLWADRLHLLYRLSHGQKGVVAAPVSSILRFLPPKIFVANCSRVISAGDEVDRNELTLWFAEMGYTDVSLVEDVGEFSVRGGIIDVWSPSSNEPVRFEQEGERVLSMRSFNPATQRSGPEVSSVNLLPVRDIPFNPEAARLASGAVTRLSDDSNFPSSDKQRLLEYIRERVPFSGLETFMPLFHGATATLLDYLPQDLLIVTDDPTEVEKEAARYIGFLEDLSAHTASLERLIPVELLYLNFDLLKKVMDDFQQIIFNALVVHQGGEDISRVLSVETSSNADLKLKRETRLKEKDPFENVVFHLKGRITNGERIIFTSHTDVQAERIVNLFKWYGISLSSFGGSLGAVDGLASGRMSVSINKLSAGFHWPDLSLSIVTEDELFGSKITRRVQKEAPAENFTSFSELTEGDCLVHEQHGIGRYLGLKNLTIDELNNDFIILEYLGGDKLYLPVYRIGLVQRYVGPDGAPPFLDKLGGAKWSRVQKKARADIVAIAKELLNIYASREVCAGFRYPPPDTSYEEFAAEFPYDETPDQERAIEDVLRDMEIEKPMDRLICGDVGYGKTEVAMRAAFKAVMAGKQVAVLVPTTLLAFQHYENFIQRFKQTPVRIEMLSRFRTPAERKAIVEELKKGTIDIVVGTHSLLQKGVSFRDLGLLVIDEEQKFGVTHKERIKKLKCSVDCMTLTATPIPRTLHLSLTGIRDISVINTPPVDRLSISTEILPFDEGIIRHAILSELARDGEVFFVHNRVETIYSMEEQLKKLVPEAVIGVAHGQMDETDLENVMAKFIKREINLLLTTTIIEAGIDIPSANTIIVNRADTFGLSQLYQIRGRIGRSNRRGFAYLLIPDDGSITPSAKRRLTVLQHFTELGSGFQIAMHDLEIRGSGSILGRAQSGHVAAIGYEMYTKLLTKEISKLKGKKVEEDIDPELSLMVSAFLPEDYVSDPGTRLDLYRRLATRESVEEILHLGEELADRFGKLPHEALLLLGVMEIKVLTKRLRVKKMLFDGRSFVCTMDSSNHLDLNLVAELVESDRERYLLRPPDKILRITKGIDEPDEIINEAKNLLRRLDSCVSEKDLRHET